MMLVIKGLKAGIADKEILKGLDLTIRPGELHVLMGPNGSGKSTLAKVLAGSPEFIVHNGEMEFFGKDLKKLTPDKRAKTGIFLGFQQPVEVPGVSVFNFLRRAKIAALRSPRQFVESSNASAPASAKGGLGVRSPSASLVKTSPHAETPRASQEFREELKQYMSELKLPEDFLRRSLNEGFSGGEKKRNEILQMMALRPKLVILDEIDSGLDVDALKLIAKAIALYVKETPLTSVLLITHYARILKYLKPNFVHIMVEGRIVKSGRSKLAREIERSGYEKFQTKIQNAKFKSQNYNSKAQSL